MPRHTIASLERDLDIAKRRAIDLEDLIGRIRKELGLEYNADTFLIIGKIMEMNANRDHATGTRCTCGDELSRVWDILRVYARDPRLNHEVMDLSHIGMMSLPPDLADKIRHANKRSPY